MIKQIQKIELIDKELEGYKKDQEENVDLINPQNSGRIDLKEEVNKQEQQIKDNQESSNDYELEDYLLKSQNSRKKRIQEPSTKLKDHLAFNLTEI